jgi:hypothetical protein
MKPELPKRKGPHELMLPRWAIPPVWAVLVLAIQILLPWIVSRLGPRFGWSPATPARWNLTGLIAVAIGLALYVWCLAFHFKSYRASVRVGFSPPHLIEAILLLYVPPLNRNGLFGKEKEIANTQSPRHNL